jgi:hypothetical protein
MSFAALFPLLLLCALLPAWIRALRGHPFSWLWALLSLLAVPTGIGWFALLGAAIGEPRPPVNSSAADLPNN